MHCKNSLVYQSLLGILLGLSVYFVLTQYGRAPWLDLLLLFSTLVFFSSIISLPKGENKASGLLLLVIGSAAYAFVATKLYHQVHDGNFLFMVTTGYQMSTQFLLSFFLALVFYYNYARHSNIQYPTLFSSLWHVYLMLGFVVLLMQLWAVFHFLTIHTSHAMGFTLFNKVVTHKLFACISYAWFFCMGVYILQHKKELLVKVRDIHLKFLKVLYPVYGLLLLAAFVCLIFFINMASSSWSFYVGIVMLHVVGFNAYYQDGQGEGKCKKGFYLVNIINSLLFLFLLYGLIQFGYSIKGQAFSTSWLYAFVWFVVSFMFLVSYGFTFLRKQAMTSPFIGRINRDVLLILTVFFLVIPIIPLSNSSSSLPSFSKADQVTMRHVGHK